MLASHKEILVQIQKAPQKYKEQRKKYQTYHGTPHTYYGLDVPTQRNIVKKWLRKHPDLSYEKWLHTIDSLNQGTSFEEKVIAVHLLKILDHYKQQCDPKMLEKWLGNLVGWAEVDTLCQSSFSADELLEKWQKWTRLLEKFSRSKSVSKKRASLVLLTKPVRDTNDERLQKLAIRTIDQLKHESDPLITKAISWLLREMTLHHKNIVRSYLRENTDVLPSFIRREVERKISTGKR